MARQQNPDGKTKNQVDPEMLKNLDLLMNMDVLESEADWDNIENMDEDSDIPDEEIKDEA